MFELEPPQLLVEVVEQVKLEVLVIIQLQQLETADQDLISHSTLF